MGRSIRVSRKYVRKNRPAAPGTNIGVRLQDDALEHLDAWMAKQDDSPSRPEAIRRLLAKALASEADTANRRKGRN
jgi:metal-responsive CopG/Arc/MetJ family transcriptional regulator